MSPRLIYLAAGALVAASCRSPAGELLEAGQRALVHGRYREAIACYEEVVLEVPASPEAARALLEIGLIHYLKLRDVYAARASFRKLVADYPESSAAREARRTLARMYEEDLADPEKAIREYTRLLEATADPDEEKSLRLSIAGCRYILNDLGQAATQYRRILAKFPYDERSDYAFLKLARIEALMGRPGEALETLERLLERSSEPLSRRSAYLAQADLLEQLGRYQEVEASLAEARREFPVDSVLAERARRLAERRPGRAATAGGEDWQRTPEGAPAPQGRSVGPREH